MLLPSRVTAAMHTTAIKATIRPYSTIVAPSSRTNIFRTAPANFCMTHFLVLKQMKNTADASGTEESAHNARLEIADYLMERCPQAVLAQNSRNRQENFALCGTS